MWCVPRTAGIPEVHEHLVTSYRAFLFFATPLLYVGYCGSTSDLPIAERFRAFRVIGALEGNAPVGSFVCWGPGRALLGQDQATELQPRRT